MQSEELRLCLESVEQARELLLDWGVTDFQRGQASLRALADVLGLAGLSELCHPLGRYLPHCADPDMALNNLDRYLTSAGPDVMATLMEARARTLEALVQLLSTSQYFSDLLVANPEFLPMLRVPLRSSPSRVEMLEELRRDVDSATDDAGVLRALRRFRQKQTLRIGTNDIIRDRPLEEITRDISRVADTALEVALHVAQANVSRRFGRPLTEAGQPARCVILAFGKLGGAELNYSSDIDLMFLYDHEGQTQGERIAVIGNDEFFARVCSEVVRLLSAHTDHGQAYRVDLRLRPEGSRGVLARSLASTLAYYDNQGRTWERQALIKVRPVAGDPGLGEEFLQAITPFVYRKYLSSAEINEIKAIKRRIETKSGPFGESDTEVKTGHGGIRDIEFTIQYLQLLNGGDLPAIRQRNTLHALQALERAGCLTDPEYRVLDGSYRFLRKVEHRLQLMFDLQTHRLPNDSDALDKLALRMGYGTGRQPAEMKPREPRLAFIDDYREKTRLNRTILNHLLHQSFSDSDTDLEADLILDPHPDPQRIQAVLGKYSFRDIPGAYQHLSLLATETTPFLSSRRCRQFFANIAAPLLRTVAETADPDLALVNLEKVSASLGGKAVLWELFSVNAPSLKLYVELCAGSQFLSELLIKNPGMIDEVLDSLVLNLPRTFDELCTELANLCKNAVDLDPILHSFQEKELLRIGVRDILGKDGIRDTTRALSDLAETILREIVGHEHAHLIGRLGQPWLADPQRACPFVLLGLGKLGSQEMNYHSDVDLVLIYEADGQTEPRAGSTAVDALQFFTELAQRTIRAASQLGPRGRLYPVDMRLRPSGESGNLAQPLSEFERYFHEGGAQLWERQALSRARIIFGAADFASHAMAVMQHIVFDLPWQPAMCDEMRSMRYRLEEAGSKRDLKRGPGGIIDIEFITQMYRLKYGWQFSALRQPNTWSALDALADAELISLAEHGILRACYDFLRSVEGRLRIYYNRSLDELPDSPDELEKLARHVGCEPTSDLSAGQVLLQVLDWHATQTRGLFDELLRREKGWCALPPGAGEHTTDC